MLQQLGRNGLNVWARAFLQEEEFARSTMTVTDSNMKKRNVKMSMIYVFSHFLMNYPMVSYFNHNFFVSVSLPYLHCESYSRKLRLVIKDFSYTTLLIFEIFNIVPCLKTQKLSNREIDE